MTRTKRPSISMKGLTYSRLRAWCTANGKTISGAIEEWAEARLRSQTPLRTADLWVVELDGGALRFVVAPDAETAEQIIQTKYGLGHVPRLVPNFDRTRITSWHYGVLTTPEAIEILGREKVSDPT